MLLLFPNLQIKETEPKGRLCDKCRKPLSLVRGTQIQSSHLLSLTHSANSGSARVLDSVCPKQNAVTGVLKDGQLVSKSAFKTR